MSSKKDIIGFSQKYAYNNQIINVALTRARKKLIVIGDEENIRQRGKLLASFIEYAKAKGGLFDYSFK